jgi:CRISPR-associated protein Cas2
VNSGRSITLRQASAATPYGHAARRGGKLAGPDIAAIVAYRCGMSDAARTLFLVCYDVCETKIRERVRKFLMAYKVGGQKSFFECWLTAAELRDVRLTLAELIDPVEDRVHIFQLDPRMRRDLLGRATQPVTDVFLIV